MDRRTFLIGAGAIAAALPRQAKAARPQFRMAYPDKSPPNSWRDEDGDMRGILVDLTAEVAAAADYDFLPVPLPLPRVQAEVESGEVDGMCLVVTPARLEYAVPTAEPLTTGHVTLFVRRDNPAFDKLAAVKSLDDLAKAGITVIASEGNGWIRENIEKRGIKTVFANGTVGTVRMLIGKRGDVIADMSHQINWITNEIDSGNEIAELPAVMDNVDWHLLISKKSLLARDMARLDEAVRKMKEAGKAAEIFQRYGIKA